MLSLLQDPNEPVFLFTRPIDSGRLAGAGIDQPPSPPVENGSVGPPYHFHGRMGRGGRIIFDRWGPESSLYFPPNHRPPQPNGWTNALFFLFLSYESPGDDSLQRDVGRGVLSCSQRKELGVLNSFEGVIQALAQWHEAHFLTTGQVNWTWLGTELSWIYSTCLISN